MYYVIEITLLNDKIHHFKARTKKEKDKFIKEIFDKYEDKIASWNVYQQSDKDGGS